MLLPANPHTEMPNAWLSVPNHINDGLDQYIEAILAIHDGSYPHVHLVPVNEKKQPCQIVAPCFGGRAMGWQMPENKLKRDEVEPFLRQGFHLGYRIGFIPYYSGLVVMDMDEFTKDSRREFEETWQPEAFTKSRGFTKDRFHRRHYYLLLTPAILASFGTKKVMKFDEGEFILKGQAIFHNPQEPSLQYLMRECPKRKQICKEIFNG